MAVNIIYVLKLDGNEDKGRTENLPPSGQFDNTAHGNSGHIGTHRNTARASDKFCFSSIISIMIKKWFLNRAPRVNWSIIIITAKILFS